MKKNVMKILFIVLLSTAIFAQRQDNGLINDSNVRVRAEPNLNSEILFKVHRGYFVNILERSEHKEKIGDMEAYWYKIDRLPFGEGWMYGYYLDIGGVKQTDEVFVLEKTETDFVFVEGGTFNIDNLTDTTIYRQSRVEVPSFYMQEHEVTIRDFMIFTQDSLQEFDWYNLRPISRVDTPDNNIYDFNYDFPMYRAYLKEILLYCNWLSKKRGLEPVYILSTDTDDSSITQVTWYQSANGYRLPTEIEWEYAALGGNKSKGYKYSGSNNADEVAWYFANSDNVPQGEEPKLSEWENKSPHEVMQKKTNELGLYDMSGNVREFCFRDLNVYRKAVAEEIISTQTTYDAITGMGGTQKKYLPLARGGTWLSNENELLVTNKVEEVYHRPSGFRLVRNAN